MAHQNIFFISHVLSIQYFDSSKLPDVAMCAYDYFAFSDAMSKELDQVLGQMEVELDGRVEMNTSQETNLGLYNKI